ncbi:transglutaminaseTgpA domain-containing protein [Halorussus amylolyticus]|uniref:transglutaminaseTgpA domain-containing protein n=1 Tax=Halorussus amylolyticus TaxID=1126242 RepID=UPI00138F2214|nr:transglutaminaseTgpA domain-containing protein [Halorussus amylolyticus]
MPDTPPSLVSDDDESSGRLRLFLALCCVAAVVLASTVLPALSSAGLGGSPLGSVVPQPGVDPYGPDAPAGGAGGAGSPGGAGDAGALSGAGGLGALNPGDTASVGGSLAADDETNAFRSQNAETHFTVESSAPSYWRTGAYDTYTGSGWERSDDREPYAGPLESEAMTDRRVEYRVTLNRSATALPSVWRPESISGPNSVLVTDRRAFVSSESLPAGTTYTGVSRLPPRDTTVLRTAGQDYPAEIEGRYTALPDDTDDRLGEFTANLTADADTSYEAATEVESWLEANKNYSLNASEPEGDVASEFVFEMDEGYCEYFATAMTAMLRSQDVPARYVVGYSTGQQVGSNTYEVRGMNAHAWVEVYFPDAGWVRFDPTPGSDRLRSEQAALQNQTGSATDYESVEEGSPNETFSANDSDAEMSEDGTPPESGTSSEDGTPPEGDTSSEDATDTGDSTTGPPSGTTDGDATDTSGGETTGGDTADESDATDTSDASETSDSSETTESGGSETTTEDESDESDSEDSDDSESEDTEDDSTESDADTAYAVELNRTPVPGATVTAAVTRGGSPAEGVGVLFNGERIGTTDDAGEVAGEVPYARNLTIAVAGESETETVDASGEVPGGGGGGGGARRRPPPPRRGGGAAPRLPPAPTAPNARGGETFRPPGGVGTPAFDAPASVETPGVLAAPPPRTLAAQARNESNGSRSYSLETNATLAVSGDRFTDEEVVVTATVEDVPLRNAAVVIDGEEVGETDRRGRAEVRLPDSPGNVTLAVSRGPVTGETTVSLPKLNVTADPSLPLALPGTEVEVSASYEDEPVSNASVSVGDREATTDIDGAASVALPFQSSATAVVSAHGQTERATVSGLLVNLFGVVAGAALVVGGLGLGAYRRGITPRRVAGIAVAIATAIPRFAVGALFAVADFLERAIRNGIGAIRELLAREATVREVLARLRVWLGERLSALRERARSSLRDAGGSIAGASATDAPADDPDVDSYRTLREAWRDFLGRVSVRRPDAMTPGELAAHAVRVDDLPADAVATLRDAFRDVEYGARSPAERLPGVEAALTAIEEATRPDDETGDQSPEGGEQ